MVSSTQKLTLSELHKLVKIDLDFAKENAKLSESVPCFEDQQEYWNAKVEAFQVIVDGIEKTQEFLETVKQKKNFLSNFLNFKPRRDV